MFLENISSRTLIIIAVAIVVLIIAKIIGKAFKICLAIVVAIVILSLTGVIDSTSLFGRDFSSGYYCQLVGGDFDVFI